MHEISHISHTTDSDSGASQFEHESMCAASSEFAPRRSSGAVQFSSADKKLNIAP